MLVGELDGELIAWAAYAKMIGNAARFFACEYDRSTRGRGLGRAILHALEDRARHRGYKRQSSSPDLTSTRQSTCTSVLATDRST
ncbi:MAG: GNAT family N-acetyltransferase [Micromonosporaceae bacterium]